VAAHVLDAVELGVLVRIGGFLPGARALEADVVLAQDLAQPLAADDDPPVMTPSSEIGGEVGGEFAQAPVRERAAQLRRAGVGRRDDECDVVVTDQAGTPLPPTEGPARPAPVG
jgi:hypothetical protein